MEVKAIESHTESRGDMTLSERGQVLADVSNAVVRIHKRFYGKGPVKARAHLSQDLLTVILEGGFTRGEQTLQDHGHAQEVVRSRLAMQQSIESEFRTAIETILYRSVRSFMSANDPSNDLQAEIFVLHPRGSESLDGDGAGDASAADGSLSERAQRAVGRNREVLDEHRALRAEQEQSRRALQDERSRN
jgi:uncharacterized protein YbcI